MQRIIGRSGIAHSTDHAHLPGDFAPGGSNHGHALMDGDSSLLSVGEVARRLERSTEQVRRYLREGRLSGRRIGGQWFIDRATLDEFTSSMRVQATFVEKLGKATSVPPLDDVIGIGSGTGTNIGEGKLAYRAQTASRRS